MVQPRLLDEQVKHVAGDEEGNDGRDSPSAEADDQRAAERLEVLDDRHAIFVLDDHRRARTALKNPV